MIGDILRCVSNPSHMAGSDQLKSEIYKVNRMMSRPYINELEQISEALRRFGEALNKSGFTLFGKGPRLNHWY